MPIDIDQVAQSLLNHSRRGMFYPEEWHGKLSLEEAYRVNLAITETKIANGERQAGWKVGVTAKAMQVQQGVHEPVFGVLFESGRRQSGVTFAMSDLIRPAFENELCVCMDRTLTGPGVTVADVRRAIHHIQPALEIVERRGDFKDLPLAMADNAQQKAFVVGAAVPAGALPSSLGDSWVEVRIDEVLQERASGKEVMGDPAASVAWLANKLAQFGRSLEAGMVVMSGSFTKQYPLEGPARIESRFDHFGPVSAIFA